ncbi:MAG: hypothetical protein ACTSPV_19630, partial [Candidatus Hodarchaeales archaeon]
MELINVYNWSPGEMKIEQRPNMKGITDTISMSFIVNSITDGMSSTSPTEIRCITLSIHFIN